MKNRLSGFQAQVSKVIYAHVMFSASEHYTPAEKSVKAELTPYFFIQKKSV